MFLFQNRGAFLGLAGLAAIIGGCSARVRTASIAIRYELAPEQTTSIEPNSLRTGPIEVVFEGPSAGGDDGERWSEIATQMLARRLYGDVVEPRSRGDETGGASAEIRGTIHVILTGPESGGQPNADEEPSAFARIVFTKKPSDHPSGPAGDPLVDVVVRSNLELISGKDELPSTRSETSRAFAGVP